MAARNDTMLDSTAPRSTGQPRMTAISPSQLQARTEPSACAVYL
jgi:hypothetical protein